MIPVENKVEIKGKVSALDWDDDDNVIEVGVRIGSGAVYTVEIEGLGRDFLSLDRFDVIVTGRTSRDDLGRWFIHVDDYELV